MTMEEELALMNKSLEVGLDPGEGDIVSDLGEAEGEVPEEDEEVIEGDPTIEEPELEGDSGETDENEETPDPKPEVPTEPSALDKALSRIEELERKLAPKEPDPPPAESPLTFEEQDFLGEEDAYEMVQDPKRFNKLLNQIYQRAVTDTRKVLGEGVLRSIPDIVKTNLTIMTSLQRASDKFYDENKDLVPFKKVVSTVFEEMSSTNPDKKYDVILKDVGVEARRRLDLHKSATQPDPKAPRLPRPKGRSGSSSDKPKTDPLLNEIEEMNKALGR